jgi:stress response protein YsnF
MINSKTLGLAGDRLGEPGLWHRLFGRDIQQYEATVYGRSVEAGGVVLTIRVPEADAARATSILNAHQAIDLTKRAEQTGLLTTAPAMATKPAMVRPPAPATVVATGPVPSGNVPAGTVTGEEILALAEEQINVGKRVVREGTTRIRRFVTETPVEAQVTLHEEHARVLRRASTDPNFLRNIDWTDKTIEITESAEEAVVTKSVHITEEVVIQREGSDKVKTVHDKVRRQQVEVERVPAGELVGKK